MLNGAARDSHVDWEFVSAVLPLLCWRSDCGCALVEIAHCAAATVTGAQGPESRVPRASPDRDRWRSGGPGEAVCPGAIVGKQVRSCSSSTLYVPACAGLLRWSTAAAAIVCLLCGKKVIHQSGQSPRMRLPESKKVKEVAVLPKPPNHSLRATLNQGSFPTQPAAYRND